MIILTLTVSLLAAPEGANADQIEFFERKIRPVLVERCYGCHSSSAKSLKGGLRLDTREGVRKGGDSGAAVIPGKPEASRLVEAISYTGKFVDMPPKGKLPDAVVADFRRWVEMGAPDPRRDDASAPEPAMTSGREHWSFKPPQHHKLPAVRDPAWTLEDIDRFVLARLEQEQLTPASPANRYTLGRRATIDLTGLPPSAAEIEAFVKDPSPDAYEKLIDRLLASTAFGDRWARHWFDVVGYSDLVDVNGNALAGDTWRYRDYVIEAFNSAKPLDVFIHEQIAGDLLPFDSDEQRREQLIATGFLAIGAWNLQNYVKDEMYADNVDHQIEKVSRNFLGLSVTCARCHDHKFEPIPTDDYYALAGFFYSTETTHYSGVGVWDAVLQRELPERREEAQRRKPGAEIADAKLRSLEAKLARLRTEKTVVESDTQLDDEQRTARLKELVDEIRRTREKRHVVSFTRPGRPTTPAVRDVETPGDTEVRIRGSVLNRGEKVPRGFLSLTRGATRPSIPAGESGRRQLAQWLTAPEQPLTARVLVNRVWSRLIGRGIVRSVDDFGLKSEPPSHPELLDTLTRRFVEEGWALKPLLRRIMLSQTYRMSSRNDMRGIAIDPENRLLWRMHRRRLDAEVIRDGILLVSGELNRARGGPCLAVNTVDNLSNVGSMVNPLRYKETRPLAGIRNRRTVYMPLYRAVQKGDLEILSVFDFPHPNNLTGERARTTVPAQSLYLMNSPFIKEQARHLARIVLAVRGLDAAARISWLYTRVLNRPVQPVEVAAAQAFVKACAQEQESREKPSEETTLEAWTQYCHTLLASNEFLFRE